MKLEAIDTSIIFTFYQDTSAGSFDNVTEWGFVVKNPKADMDKPRWGLVTHIGPNVTDVVVGDYILVEPLRWTTNVVIDGKKLWRTVEKSIIGVSKTAPTEFV